MFNRWMQKIKQWFGVGMAPAMAPAASSVTAIDGFLRSTRSDAPTIRQAMGALTQKNISSEQFAEFCEGFAQGVSYIEKRFGTMPKDIIITDENSNSPRYNLDTQCIFLPRLYIGNSIKTGMLRETKTEPLILPFKQMAMMYGVEEAYHHYQWTKHSDKYDFDALPKPDGTVNYDKNPLERDAKMVVRDALKDFNLLDYPVATEKIDNKDIAWLEAARHEQNAWRAKVQSPQPKIELST